MVMDTGKGDIPDNTGKLPTNGKAKIYRILRLRPCTNEEVVAITGFYPWLVQDAIGELSAAGLLVNVRHGRFFSRTNAIWRYQRPEQRYLIGIIIGGIFVALGVNQFAYFLFAPGIILLGVFISLFG